jgi:hypothetical protein
MEVGGLNTNSIVSREHFDLCTWYNDVSVVEDTNE